MVMVRVKVNFRVGVEKLMKFNEGPTDAQKLKGIG